MDIEVRIYLLLTVMQDWPGTAKKGRLFQGIESREFLNFWDTLHKGWMVKNGAEEQVGGLFRYP